MQRRELTDAVLFKAIEIVTHNVGRRLEKHGRGAIISNHEGLGIVTEEYHELVGAVTSNDNQRVAEEMVDIAVSGIIAVASMVAGAEVVAEEPEVSSEQLPLFEEKPQFVDMDSAADRARQLMIERARASNIHIADKL